MGQSRLLRASVLVIGAGGLGSPVLFALAGAGVGRIGIVDLDSVAASNLNRQFLYTAAEIGESKATCAAARLAAYHPDLMITPYAQRLDTELAYELFPQYDLIVACVDNLATRQIINQVICALKKTLVDGGIRGMSGYAAAVQPGMTACLDCYFGLNERVLAAIGKTKNPIAALGATASVIGSLMAQTVILLLLGLANPLAEGILTYHGQTLSFEHQVIARDPSCASCGGLFQTQKPWGAKHDD